MAKKKSTKATTEPAAAEPGKPNKSELVRAYMAEHPTAKPKEVAAAVSAQAGIEIGANYVSVVKQNMKAKGGKKGAGKAKGTPGRKAGATPSNGTIGVLSAADAFVAAAGGLAAAQDVLAMLARMRG